MSVQILPIDEITLRAQAAVVAGFPATACPFPEESEAGARWLAAYCARAHGLQATPSIEAAMCCAL